MVIIIFDIPSTVFPPIERKYNKNHLYCLFVGHHNSALSTQTYKALNIPCIFTIFNWSLNIGRNVTKQLFL